MKVLSAEEMSRIERVAFSKGYSAETFMEQAGLGIATEIEKWLVGHSLPKHITLLCGKGNNTGDAYVAGTHLIQRGFTVLAIDAAEQENSLSPLCKKMKQRFIAHGGLLHPYKKGITTSIHTAAWVDGLFGTGFRGEMKANYANLCAEVNASGLPILSIDIPSGINGNSGTACPQALKADLTIFLGLPKTGFFIREGYDHIGSLVKVDFGLPSSLIEAAKAELELFDPSSIKIKRKRIKRTRHKYESGCVLGLSGSPEMPGAALLAAEAALRSGAGMVYLIGNKATLKQMQTRPKEVICHESPVYAPPEKLLSKSTSLFVGPGLREDRKEGQKLTDFLCSINKPVVIDAEALNCLAKSSNLRFPKQALLTPHLQEMHRLLGFSERHDKDRAFYKACQDFTIEHNTTLLLKGGPNFLFTPLSLPVILPEGNPGLAKAGTGDVLSGVLAALLARGYTPPNAAIFGAHLHGRAANLACRKLSHHGMMASDLIAYIPRAYAEMMHPLQTYQEDFEPCFP